MELKDKAEIIVQFTQEFIGESEYDDWFDYNDLGVPLAVGIVNDLIILTTDGIRLFNETWENLCKEFEQDPNGEYSSIDDILEY